jgi:uncharacterized protein (DUF1810 family)
MKKFFGLDRFVDAQNPLFEQVCTELRNGRKTTHWMWFVFPQIEGLGLSAISVRYAIQSEEEAIAYLAHPVLGPRLVRCTELAIGVENRTAREIFGEVDEVKFCSCMTLFATVCREDSLFVAALEKYFGGQRDKATSARLASK